MAADLATWPTTGLHSQSRDAHLMNFGAFGKHDGSLVFDLMISTRPAAAPGNGI